MVELFVWMCSQLPSVKKSLVRPRLHCLDWCVLYDWMVGVFCGWMIDLTPLILLHSFRCGSKTIYIFISAFFSCSLHRDRPSQQRSQNTHRPDQAELRTSDLHWLVPGLGLRLLDQWPTGEGHGWTGSVNQNQDQNQNLHLPCCFSTFHSTDFCRSNKKLVQLFWCRCLEKRDSGPKGCVWTYFLSRAAVTQTLPEAFALNYPVRLFFIRFIF